MNPQNPLAELKDIHLPAPAPWWDIALGWWLLVMIVVALLFWGLPKIVVWSKQRKKRQNMLLSMQTHLANIQEVYQKQQDSHLALVELSIFLRRVCLTVFGEKQTAGLIGKPWLTFLDRQWGEFLPEVSFGSESIAVLLNDVSYQKPSENITEAQLQQLIQLTQDWLRIVEKQMVIKQKVMKQHV